MTTTTTTLYKLTQSVECVTITAHRQASDNYGTLPAGHLVRRDPVQTCYGGGPGVCVVPVGDDGEDCGPPEKLCRIGLVTDVATAV